MSAPRRAPGPLRRGWWKGPLLLAAIAVLPTVAAIRGERGDGGPPEAGAPEAGARDEAAGARVLEVTDGDTIVARLQDGRIEDVRYIGIDTPESSPDAPLECFGPKASTENERLVGGRPIELRFGPELRDVYGRLLAYVFLPARARGGPDLFVNAELVRRGYARTLTIAPNDARAPLLARLEAAAGRAGRGLWAACKG